MGKIYETFLRPEAYRQLQDITIVKPPLIRTSTEELARAGYNLFVESRWLSAADLCRIKLRFIPPSGGPAGLKFDVSYHRWIASEETLLANLPTLLGRDPKNLTDEAATVVHRVFEQPTDEREGYMKCSDYIEKNGKVVIDITRNIRVRLDELARLGYDIHWISRPDTLQLNFYSRGSGKKILSLDVSCHRVLTSHEEVVNFLRSCSRLSAIGPSFHVEESAPAEVVPQVLPLELDLSDPHVQLDLMRQMNDLRFESLRAPTVLEDDPTNVVDFEEVRALVTLRVSKEAPEGSPGLLTGTGT